MADMLDFAGVRLKHRPAARTGDDQMDQLTIRPATLDEFAIAVDWAACEGWNPGLGDLEVFHDTDANGFLMGFEGDEPVSSISVIRYGDDFGFLGFYIVREDRRGRGAGIATWNAGMAYLGGRTVGLDGVIEQQKNYARSGFELFGRNIRHAGTAKIHAAPPAGVVLRPLVADTLAAAIMYDSQHFPVGRDRFIGAWLLPSDGAVKRWSLLAETGEKIVGIGTIRACRAGYKVGPLFADDEAIASALLSELVAGIPPGQAVSLDTPEDNERAVDLAIRAGLVPVFETARMYRGKAPVLPHHCIFGVTTFELG
jgi:Acetyltransferase (GNAT) domain/Acetyltransferase (GNAT) family